uniref:Uncharacterized protein n=1 Tax=Romanomermis culicivorax TaxID=13658 RepID=A0A915JGL3_ROMCU
MPLLKIAAVFESYQMRSSISIKHSRIDPYPRNLPRYSASNKSDYYCIKLAWPMIKNKVDRFTKKKDYIYHRNRFPRRLAAQKKEAKKNIVGGVDKFFEA